MVERLGEVLGGGATLIAVLCWLLAGYEWFFTGPGDTQIYGWLFAAFGTIVWLVGRGIRYILAGH